MHQNDNGEIVMSRREYSQLMAAMPASHAVSNNDDDSWFSDLFGGDDGPSAPGFFTDVQYRHEDEVVIEDPEIVDFVGGALDVIRPNEYDEAVRIRVAGDVAVEGEDISPKSVTAESVDTEQENTAYFIHAGVDDAGQKANDLQAELPSAGDYGNNGGLITYESAVHDVATKIDLQDGVLHQGRSERAASLRATDAFTGDTVLHAHPSVSEYFGGLSWLHVNGNKANTSTKGLVHDSANGGKFNDFHIEHAFFDDCDQEALNITNNAWGWRFSEVHVEHSGPNAVEEAAYLALAQAEINGLFVSQNQAEYAVTFDGPSPSNTTAVNVVLRGNDQNGGRVSTEGYTFTNLQCYRNSVGSSGTYDSLLIGGNANGTVINGAWFDGQLTDSSPTTRYGIVLNANDCAINGGRFQNHANGDIIIQGDRNTVTGVTFAGTVSISGTDNELWGCAVGTLSDSGTRTRWNGIIAGGPLGGTDIGSLTGASAGDVAMADGTTATNADTLWILKSAGDWQRVDGGATITPA